MTHNVFSRHGSRPKYLRLLPAAIGISCLLAGCGGGSSSNGSGAGANAVPAVSGSQNGTQGLGRAQIVIKVPAASASATSLQKKAGRTLKYVSPGTESVGITVNSASTVTADLTTDSPNCTSDDTGITCTVTIPAPLGKNTFALTTYTGLDGTGEALSTNTVNNVVVTAAGVVVPVVLNGIVSKATLTLAQTAPSVGAATTIPLSVELSDATGADIIGAEAFENPITLTDSDGSGATTLSKTVLNSPADLNKITLAYTGANIGTATLSATGTGLDPSNITPAILTPSTASPDIANYIQSVSFIDPGNTPHDGTPEFGNLPAPGTAPAITLTNNSDSAMGVAGGSVLVTFTATQPLQQLFVGVNSVSGFYQSNLTSSDAVASTDAQGRQFLVTKRSRLSVGAARHALDTQATPSYQMVIDIPTTFTGTSLNLSLVGVFSTSLGLTYSAAVPIHVSMNTGGVPSDVFQASLSWRAPVDLDLHVLPPDGTPEIYYGNPSSDGGTLDVDSVCNPNGGAENITWADGTAPNGQYRIRVDYNQDCGYTQSVPYVLTVRTSGEVPTKYVGTFDPGTADADAPAADTSPYVYFSTVGS